MTGKPWNESFDTYLEQTEDGPIAVVLDMAAAAHAPLAGHSVRWKLVVRMQQPYENGLRSRAEAPALFALEDRLLPAMKGLGAVFVGRLVHGGATVFCLYSPDSLETAAVESAVEPVRGEYSVQIRRDLDPDWAAYLEDLYPSPLQRQFMLNRQVLDSLAKKGDQHSLPRELDHLAYFPSEESAQHAAAALRERHFSVKVPVGPRDGADAWALGFSRVDTLAEGRADEVTEEVFSRVTAHGGHYDGWGCVVQKPKPGLFARLLGRGR